MKNVFYLLMLLTFSHLQLQAQQLPVKIGFVDTENVVRQLPDTKQLEEQVKATQARLEADYTTKQQRFQKEYADFAANMNTMQDTARARAQASLQQLSGELQQFEQDAKETLTNTRRLYMAPIYLKIGKAIDEVAAENGFSLIIPRNVSGMKLLLYANEKWNITTLVLTKLGVTAENTTQTPPPKKTN